MSQKRKSLRKIAESKGNYYDPRARTPAMPEYKLEAETVVKQSLREQKHASKHINRLRMCEKELVAAERNTALLRRVNDSRNRVQELLSNLENIDGKANESDNAVVNHSNVGALAIFNAIPEFSGDADKRARRKLEREIEERSIEKEKIVKSLAATTTIAHDSENSLIKPSLPTVKIEKAVEEAANQAQIWKKELIPFSRKMLRFARKTHDEGQAALEKVERQLLDTEQLLNAERDNSNSLHVKIASSEREIAALKSNRDKQVTKIAALQEKVRNVAAKQANELEAMKKENLQMQKELSENQYIMANAEKKLEAEKENSEKLLKEVASLNDQVHQAKQAAIIDKRRIKSFEKEIVRCTKALQEAEQNHLKENERLKDNIKILTHETNELKATKKTMEDAIEKLQHDKEEEAKVLNKEIQAAKEEEERLEKELELLNQEHRKIVEKCDSLESEMISTNAKLGTLENEKAENSANQAGLKESLSIALKEAAALRRKVNEYSQQLKLADEKIATLSLPPKVHKDKSAQTSTTSTDNKSLKETIKEMKKQHLLERQHFREEYDLMQRKNNEQVLRIGELENQINDLHSELASYDKVHGQDSAAVERRLTMHQKGASRGSISVKSERELYDTFQNIENSAIETTMDNGDGLSEWEDSGIVKVQLPTKPKKMKNMLMDKLGNTVRAKVSTGTQTEKVISRHTTVVTNDNLPVETLPLLEAPTTQHGAANGVALTKSHGFTVRECIAQQNADRSENTLNQQARILENVYKKKLTNIKVKAVLSRILFNQQRRFLCTKLAWARWSQRTAQIKGMLPHFEQVTTLPEAERAHSIDITELKTKALPSSGYEYDPRTDSIHALPNPNIVDIRSKVGIISQACLELQRKACVGERSTLLSIAALLKAVADCVMQDQNTEKYQGLKVLCTEWLAYIEKRVPLLQQEEVKVKSQLTQDLMHFITKDSYCMVNPQSLPQHTLKEYKPRIQNRAKMDTPDMPHVVIPAKETFAPTTTASPKRRYNKKRYIAPRLKAIPKSTL
eukprot:g15141.t1